MSRMGVQRIRVQRSAASVQGSNSSNTCYLCPWCLRNEKLAGRWDSSMQRPQSMLAARDLPCTQLSDHIELRVRAYFSPSRTCAAAWIVERGCT